MISSEVPTLSALFFMYFHILKEKGEKCYAQNLSQSLLAGI